MFCRDIITFYIPYVSLFRLLIQLKFFLLVVLLHHFSARFRRDDPLGGNDVVERISLIVLSEYKLGVVGEKLRIRLMTITLGVPAIS